MLAVAPRGILPARAKTGAYDAGRGHLNATFHLPNGLPDSFELELDCSTKGMGSFRTAWTVAGCPNLAHTLNLVRVRGRGFVAHVL